MENFGYFELIASFYRGMFNFIKQGSTFEMAVNRSLDDFWQYPELDNRLSNLIVIIQYQHVKYATNKSFTSKGIEVYKNQLELIRNKDLTIWLNPEELAHLNESIFDLNAEIEEFLRETTTGC